MKNLLTWLKRFFFNISVDRHIIVEGLSIAQLQATKTLYYFIVALSGNQPRSQPQPQCISWSLIELVLGIPHTSYVAYCSASMIDLLGKK